MRLIDADKLKTHYSWWTDETKELFDTIINLQPTVEAEPIRHGKWVKVDEDSIEEHNVYKCSECGELYDWFDVPEHKYCRHCGAKMDEV